MYASLRRVSSVVLWVTDYIDRSLCCHHIIVRNIPQGEIGRNTARCKDNCVGA